MIYSNEKYLSVGYILHGEKKLLNQQMSSAGIGTAVFFVIFIDFSVGFTDCW